MKIIALVGPTGSGKSHRALLVAHERQIDLIIDDGLLIRKNLIVAGTSSKRQPTKVGAIKTALFANDGHADEVKNKIAELKPTSILVLGTSVNMINKITQRLDLPKTSEIIMIEEIATEDEIRTARKTRVEFGKHVVPAPTVEVKPRLSGLLVDPLPTLFKRKSGKRQKHFMVDQTVVQPTFNFLGSFFISANAINHIISMATEKVDGVEEVYHIRTRTTPEGIEISLHITVIFGHRIPRVVEEAKQSIHHYLELMTSLHVLEINILVKKISMEETNV